MRNDAREAVLKLLYAEEYNTDNADALKSALFKSLSDTEYDFADKLLNTIETHRTELKNEIDAHIIRLCGDRLFPVDKAILLIATAEILYFEEIPFVVSANEATNLASKYSTDTSTGFVNGVLSGIIKDKNKAKEEKKDDGNN